MMPEYLTVDISEEQRANLTKLRDYFANPPFEIDLRMGFYARSEILAGKATPEVGCGTSACIVGHGPAAGIPLLWNEKSSVGWPFWHEYSCRAFLPVSDVWDFAFEVRWPDSIPEAVARLNLVLDGKVPVYWTYEDRFAETEAA